jgi:hypothetical protein
MPRRDPITGTVPNYGYKPDPEQHFDPEDVALVRRTAEALRRLAEVAVRQSEMNAAYHFGEAEMHLRKAFERED